MVLLNFALLFHMLGHLRQKHQGSFPVHVVRDLEMWLLCESERKP